MADLLNSCDFALLAHPANRAHFDEIVRHSRPDLAHDPAALAEYTARLHQFFESAPSYMADQPIVLEAADGRRLRGRLVICTFLPEDLQSARQMLAAHRKVEQGCTLAAAAGAQIVGLGGFTSIITGTQGQALVQQFSVPMTSGNTLTAALALAQLDEVLARLEYDLSQQTVAIVGASGDIGRACAIQLAPRSRHLILIARNRAKLEALAAACGPNAAVSTEVRDSLHASIVIAATSATHAILSEADLRPGSVVLDIGYPKNLAHTPQPRPDVLTLSGGLAQMPFALDMPHYTQLPASTLMYGCFSETMVLALAGRCESFSSGQGQIDAEKMAEIMALASAHGFRPAPPYRGDTLITDDILIEFSRRVYDHSH